MHQAQVYRRESLAAIVVGGGKNTVKSNAACHAALTVKARSPSEQMGITLDGYPYSVACLQIFNLLFVRSSLFQFDSPSQTHHPVRNYITKGYRLPLPYQYYRFLPSSNTQPCRLTSPSHLQCGQGLSPVRITRPRIVADAPQSDFKGLFLRSVSKPFAKPIVVVFRCPYGYPQDVLLGFQRQETPLQECRTAARNCSGFLLQPENLLFHHFRWEHSFGACLVLSTVTDILVNVDQAATNGKRLAALNT